VKRCQIAKIKMKNYAPRLRANSRSLRRKATPQEIILWSKIKNRNFHNLKFRRQHVIDKYIVDFVCLEKKLVVELDGLQHKREKDLKYDANRTTHLETLGFTVLRFWNNEVNDNLVGVMLRIEEFINRKF
jgi:very-short-patch-repair endonuclease